MGNGSGPRMHTKLQEYVVYVNLDCSFHYTQRGSNILVAHSPCYEVKDL